MPYSNNMVHNAFHIIPFLQLNFNKMKSKVIIIVFAVILAGFISCGGNNSNQSHSHENGAEHNPNTHTHADGTVHSDHAPEHDIPQQESFKVEADSVTLKADSVKHEHDHSDPNHQH